MIPSDRVAPPDAGALILRLAASLLLTGAALFGILAFAVTRLRPRPVSGAAGYALPGSNAVLDPLIVPVLTGCGGVMALLGLALLLLGRRSRVLLGARPDPRRVDLQAGGGLTTRRSAARPMLTLAAGVALLLAVLGWRWSRQADTEPPIRGRVDSGQTERGHLPADDGANRRDTE